MNLNSGPRNGLSCSKALPTCMTCPSPSSKLLIFTACTSATSFARWTNHSARRCEISSVHVFDLRHSTLASSQENDFYRSTGTRRASDTQSELLTATDISAAPRRGAKSTVDFQLLFRHPTPRSRQCPRHNHLKMRLSSKCQPKITKRNLRKEPKVHHAHRPCRSNGSSTYTETWGTNHVLCSDNAQRSKNHATP